jgi:hypothetical protein
MNARVLSAALVAAALTIGCGEYEGGSKDKFVDAANGVCKTVGATVMPALEELQDEGLPTNGELRGFAGDVAIPALQKRVDELRQLDPPTGDRKEIDDIIRALQKGINDVRADPRQLVDGDPFLEANADASSYGLTSCVLGAEQ